MKIRIGLGLGVRRTVDADELGRLAADAERLRFDSLWFSERLGGPGPDPIVAMTWIAARTTKLKFGTSVLVLPGRNPVVLAKEFATLDQLSGGRLLPAVGLGVADPGEQLAFGVQRGERAPWLDEALPLMRRLWTEDDVHHQGERFELRGFTLQPKPVQQPLEVWLGGQAPSELRRIGRLGDGWLPSFCTADDVRAGLPIIEQAAEQARRTIDPEHFGALVFWCEGEVPSPLLELAARRRPDGDPREIIPSGLTALRATIEQMIEAGASKFVVTPLASVGDDGLDRLADALLPLQT